MGSQLSRALLLICPPLKWAVITLVSFCCKLKGDEIGYGILSCHLLQKNGRTYLVSLASSFAMVKTRVAAVFFVQTQILDYFNIVKSKTMSLLACVQTLGGGRERRSESLHPCLMNFNSLPPPPPHTHTHNKKIAHRLCTYHSSLHRD